jgi:hypothetical protein
MKNIGKFTEWVRVTYITGEATTELGGVVKTMGTYDIYADVQMLDDRRLLEFGMNVMDKAATFTMRNEIPGRPEFISWDEGDYYVIYVKGDKKDRFLEVTAKAR